MPEPVAIVGFSFRLPGGADTPDRLWEILETGEQAWTDVPEDRYNWKAFYHPDPEARGTHNARGGFFLKQDIAQFDAKFFGIPDAEAAAMDPQQRILLEVSYEALENAGMPIEGLRGSQTGVYVALVSRDYDRQIYKDPSQIPKHHLTGCGDATACGRISYVFDFRGPSMTLDTGCSGGMVGVHLACQALQLGQSDMALVEGSNLLLGPDMTIAMSNLHMVNDNGRCYPFDSRGVGYGRAEGVAVMVLKRLSDAQADGDAIRAVILNSGVGQDGKTNGILLPNSQAQHDLAGRLYKEIGIDPQQVSYVEMHGTGTSAGDSAEIRSVKMLFVGDGSRRTKPLSVGSIKANLGHSESTSGLSGIIKAVLSLEKCRIPPVAAVKDLKPDVALAVSDGSIRMPHSVHEWSASEARRVSVNSFGFGGTNAHVILGGCPSYAVQNHCDLEVRTFVNSNGTNTCGNKFDISCAGRNGEVRELPEAQRRTRNDSVNLLVGQGSHPFLFLVSARSKESLKSNIENLKSWMVKNSPRPHILQKVSRTLATRRSTFSWRASFNGRVNSEIIHAVGSARIGKAATSSRTIFLFTGQGAQYATMGRELIRCNPVFANSLRKSEEILRSLGASWNLLEELNMPEEESRINTSQLSQPATTALQIALVNLLEHIGVRPAAVLGHSSGEVAAAYAVGALSHKAALQISYYKGFVADWCRESNKNRGAMLAVGLGENDISKYLAKTIAFGGAVVACVNSPTSVTVSGDEAAVLELKTLLDRDAIFNRPLKVGVAYHSHHMQTVAKRFEESICGLTPTTADGQTKFFSSVTATEEYEPLNPSYWIENLVSKVRFSEALESLVKTVGEDETHLAFVEIGPHCALEGPVRQIMNAQARKGSWAYSAAMRRNRDAAQTILETCGQLWEQGVCVDLQRAVLLGHDHQHFSFRPATDLPAYAWDHSKRHWHESRLSKEYRHRRHAPHDLLGLRLVGTTHIEPVFRHILSVDNSPWLQEHVIDGFALYPGSAFLVHAIEALKQVTEDSGEKKSIERYRFKTVTFNKSIVVPKSPATLEILVSLMPAKGLGERIGIRWYQFRVTSQAADGAWNDNCHGFVGCEFSRDTALFGEYSQASTIKQQLQKLTEACTKPVSTSDLYEGLRRNGIEYGENFSIISDLKVGDHVAIGSIRVPDIAQCMPSGYMQPHVVHPATFDAFMHVALPLYHLFCSQGPVMLTSIEEANIDATMLNKPGDCLTVVCELKQARRKFGAVNVSIMQDNGDGHLVEVGSLRNEEFQGIGEGPSKAETTTREGAMSCILNWKPVGASPARPVDRDEQQLQLYLLSQSAQGFAALQRTRDRLLEQVAASIAVDSTEFTKDDAIQIFIEDDSAPEMEFEDIKKLVQKQNSVLWVALGGKYGHFSSPTSLARRAARERNLQFVTLLYRDVVADSTILGDVIGEVIERSFINIDKITSVDIVYKFQDGSLFVPRLESHGPSNLYLEQPSPQEQQEIMAKFHGERALKLDFKTPGLLNSCYFTEIEDTPRPLAPDMLKVKVLAHGLNRSDVALAMGRGDPVGSMVGEFAGVVIELGAVAEGRFKRGDRVCGWGATPYANIAKVKHQLCQLLDDSTTFEQGAAIPLAFQTAYHALVDLAHLSKSHRILIHGAAGAVGQAAISIARHIGADVYATVSSDDKARSLMEATGMTREHIFSNRTAAFLGQIAQHNDGQGVDVVLDCSSGELAEASVPIVAEMGIVINLASSDFEFQAARKMRNISYVSVNMTSFKEKYPERLQEKFEKAMALYKAGCTGPSLTVLPITDLEKAFRLMTRNDYTGKIVLKSDDNVYVKQAAVKPTLPSLGQGTYAVLGGTMGVNTELCTFLVERGASDIISIVSRDSIHHEDQTPMEMVCKGGAKYERLAVDLSSPPDAKALVEKCEERLSTLSGIISVEFGAETASSIDNMRSMRSGGSSSQAVALHQLLELCASEFMITISQSPWWEESIIGPIPRKTDSAARNVRLQIPQPQSWELLEQDPKSFAMLSRMLDYCLRREAEHESPSELFMIQPHLIDTDKGHAILRNVPRHLAADNGGSKISDTPTLEQKLRQAQGQDVVKEEVAAAICEQLATFCAIDRDDIRLDASIVDLGLDSLLAIEFKNWIMGTLKAPMQTTEILDMSSLHDLVSIILRRSQIISRSSEPDTNGTSVEDASDVRGAELIKGNIQPHVAGKRPPPLPLPKLSDIVEAHLRDMRPFASDEEYNNTLRLAKEFCTEGSVGFRLYERLLASKEADPENWYHDLYMNSLYLRRKGGLAPFMQFFFTHPLSDIEHSQSERAALIAATLIRYKRDLENGHIKPQYMDEQPLCMDLYKNLFSACREPRVGLDVFKSHPSNDFFVVLWRGHAYKVDFSHLPVEENIFSLLEAAFSSILKDKPDGVDWVGILSSENRVLWARNYQKFVEASEQNARYVANIQMAAFLVCLDDGAPGNAEQRARQVHFSDGSNRWFDKSIQYVVCSNGISGMVADHTGIDAPTVQGINLAIAKAIRNFDPRQVRKPSNGLPWEPMMHTQFPGSQTSIHRARKDYGESIDKRRHFFLSLDFGSTFMRGHKVPPISGFQLIVQLASRYFFGYLPACWETVLQCQFYKGRVEINQIITMEVVEFVKAVADDAAPLSVCRAKLVRAAQKHSGNVLAAMRAGGLNRFLSMIQEIGKDDGLDPELYHDPPYLRSRPRKIMCSSFQTHMSENGCAMRDDDAIWLHFELDSDRVKFSGVGESGQTERFIAELHRASAIVCEILTSSTRQEWLDM
ncbi:Highly reducing polyketide synthase sdnO [Exophiala dermatitidis]